MMNLINDVSSLTNVSERTLKKLMPAVEYSIANSVYERHLAHEDLLEIDTGIGILHIKLSEDNIKYRFVPSKHMEEIIKQCIEYGTSPLLTKLTTDLEEKIEHAYKELL